VRHLSKKQVHHLRLAFGLLAAAVLLCFPAGIPSVDLRLGLHALIAGAVSLGLAHTLHKLGPLPACGRPGLLLPTAFSAPLILLCLPDPLSVLWLLLPFALILLAQRPRFQPLPAPLFYLPILLCLSAGAAGYLDLLTRNPNDGLPLLPNHLGLWLAIFSVIPLGFATRQRLRPLAKAIARSELWIALVLLGCYPIYWSAATSAKLPGEPALDLHRLRPLPRFYLLPKLGNDNLLPSELRNQPLQTEILFTLDEMNWRLSEAHLLSTFDADGELRPEEMLRAMKLYGFLLEDRHGAFLPGEAFQKNAPPTMEERYLDDFRHSMDQMVMSPEALARTLSMSIKRARDIFFQMQHLNWVTRIPGQPERYRLTPQARHPFANGLYPRQLRLLANADPEGAHEIDQALYGKRWQMGTRQIRRELDQLVDLQAAETRTVWRFHQHLPFITDPILWRQTALLTLSLILAWLAGRCLPDKQNPLALSIVILAACAMVWQLPYTTDILPAIRIALGIWLIRNLLPLSNTDCNRLGLFASGRFIAAVLMTKLPPQTALVHQSFWAMIWFPPALLLLSLALRKGSAKLKN
jgi:hypothetical protein